MLIPQIFLFFSSLEVNSFSLNLFEPKPKSCPRYPTLRFQVEQDCLLKCEHKNFIYAGLRLMTN